MMCVGRQLTDSHEREKGSRVIDDQEPEVDTYNPSPPFRKLKVRGDKTEDLDYGSGDGHEYHGPLDTSSIWSL
jgi:hypothetical protein